MEWCELDSAGSGQGLVASSCENGNEPSGSTNAWNFLPASKKGVWFKELAGWLAT